jgi:hypothetical protein
LLPVNRGHAPLSSKIRPADRPLNVVFRVIPGDRGHNCEADDHNQKYHCDQNIVHGAGS